MGVSCEQLFSFPNLGYIDPSKAFKKLYKNPHIFIEYFGLLQCMGNHRRIYIAFGLIISLAFELAGMTSLKREGEASRTAESLDYSVAVEAVVTNIGTNLSATWTAPAGHAGSDYLCVAKVNYTGTTCDSTYQVGSASSGSILVSLPNTVGRYEIRIFRSTDNVRMATSSTFIANAVDFTFGSFVSSIAAGGQIFVTWTAPVSRPPNDRIVLVNASTGVQVSEQNDNRVSPKALTFDAPMQTGQFEFRYYENGSSSASALSHLVTVVTSAGSIGGRVHGNSGTNLINGALVEAMQSGITIASSITNASGSYLISLSSAGTYDLRVSKSGFATSNRTGVVVASGSSLVEDFTIMDRGAVSGRIQQQNTTTPIGGAQVRLVQNSLTVATKVSDFSGNYTFSGIASGNYSIEVSAPGFQAQTQNSVAVVVGATTVSDFSLSPITGGSGNLLEYLY